MIDIWNIIEWSWFICISSELKLIPGAAAWPCINSIILWFYFDHLYSVLRLDIKGWIIWEWTPTGIHYEAITGIRARSRGLTLNRAKDLIQKWLIHPNIVDRDIKIHCNWAIYRFGANLNCSSLERPIITNSYVMLLLFDKLVWLPLNDISCMRIPIWHPDCKTQEIWWKAVVTDVHTHTAY